MEISPEPPIVWTPSLQIGIPVLDDQHRFLVKLINEVNSSMAENRSKLDIERVLYHLFYYADHHFEAEELYAEEYGFNTEMPDAASRNSAEHQFFIEKTDAIKLQFLNDQHAPKEELICFLKDWLINHIRNTDRILGEFICRKQAEST